MSTMERTMTADQYFALGDIGPSELIRGELIRMSPTGYDHGWIAGNIARSLGNFVKSKGLGRVLTAEAGFLIRQNPDTVRAPDVAFVRAERDPPGGQKKFFPGPPDLAVEVLSPDDRASEVNAKVQDWLEAGAVAVVVVDPQTQTVSVYRRSRDYQLLTRDDTLLLPELLPEFALPVKEIFS
ncbi:MAG: Uma2 family endonuclease [Pirellulales bacterium]|nr:Uma2 family endonuclease [Pirellulales bacterium]